MQKKPAPEEKPQNSSDWQKNLKQEERKAMFKKIAIWGAIILACVGGLALLVKMAGNSGPSATPTVNADLKPVTDKDIIIGDPKAQITIIEYADFQCPACASYNPVVNQILSDYDGKVRVVYRFFPLRNIHQNALISGQAGYAAEKQGKFTEIKDMLFEKQTDWAESSDSEAKTTFIAYANQIGMDTDKFEADMNSEEAKNAVLAGEQDAMSININSTPTFFIGNEQLAPSGYEGFKVVIDEELKKSGSKPTTEPLQ